MKKTILIYLFCVISITCLAQKDFSQKNRYVTSSTIYGVGFTNILDTYLSPFEYKGTDIKILGEKRRLTNILNGKVSTQRLWQVNMSLSKNRADTGRKISSMINWNYAWHYNFDINSSLKLLVGPMIDLNGGFIYNIRNSNNPAQAKAYTNIDASAMAIYKFNISNHQFIARYQLNTPFIGLMFSPEYGESYYEMFSLNNFGSKNIIVTTPFSQPSLRQLFTLDFPISKINLRIGFLSDIQQAKVNNIKSHIWTNSFMIGLVKNFFVIKGKQSLDIQ